MKGRYVVKDLKGKILESFHYKDTLMNALNRLIEKNMLTKDEIKIERI